MLRPRTLLALRALVAPPPSLPHTRTQLAFVCSRLALQLPVPRVLYTISFFSRLEPAPKHPDL